MSAKRALFLAAALVAAAVIPAQAQDPTAAIDKAKADLAAGKPIDAYLSLSNALTDLALRTPLFLTAAKFAQGPSRGYGQYDQRPHNVFTRGETIRVYVEPAGFDHARQGELFRASLACDYAILGADGKPVTADRNVKEIEIISRQANAELGVDLVLPYLDLSQGNYTLDITVRDLVAKDAATARLAFRIM